MLTINVSGWKKGYGPYELNLPFDDRRTDYEIHFKNGSLYRQLSAFETVTQDWNHDGDVYSQYGAWFRNEKMRGEFFTPVEMLRFVQEEKADIPGLKDPLAAIKGYVKAKEEEQEIKERAKAKAYPITCFMDGKTVVVPFDTTRMDYRIDLNSGQTYYQTGYFRENYFLPDRTSVSPPVMATWFKDADGQARFFTAREMLELVAKGQAKIKGIETPLQVEKETKKPNRAKHRSVDRER